EGWSAGQRFIANFGNILPGTEPDYLAPWQDAGREIRPVARNDLESFRRGRYSLRFWDVCATSVLHSTSDIMARMKDQDDLPGLCATSQIDRASDHPDQPHPSATNGRRQGRTRKKPLEL